MPLEIGGDFVGQIYAYTNMVACLSSAVMLPLYGALLDMGPIYQIETWHPVFLLILILIICGCVTFNCGKFAVLEWAKKGTFGQKCETITSYGSISCLEKE